MTSSFFREQVTDWLSNVDDVIVLHNFRGQVIQFCRWLFLLDYHIATLWWYYKASSRCPPLTPQSTSFLGYLYFWGSAATLITRCKRATYHVQNTTCNTSRITCNTSHTTCNTGTCNCNKFQCLYNANTLNSLVRSRHAVRLHKTSCKSTIV